MVASFFIRRFLAPVRGSGRRSQRECVTNEITVWLHVTVRARSLFIIGFQVFASATRVRHSHGTRLRLRAFIRLLTSRAGERKQPC